MRWRHSECRHLRERVTARQLEVRLRQWRELLAMAGQRAQALKTAGHRLTRKMQAGLSCWLQLAVRARIVDDSVCVMAKQYAFVHVSSMLRQWALHAQRMKRVRESVLLRRIRARLTVLSTSLLEWRDVVGRSQADARVPCGAGRRRSSVKTETANGTH